MKIGFPASLSVIFMANILDDSVLWLSVMAGIILCCRSPGLVIHVSDSD